MKLPIFSAAFLMFSSAGAVAQTAPPPTDAVISAAGPLSALYGTINAPQPGQPIALIIPGSGPTDRDGNNPLGVSAASYRLLAEGLAAHGIGSVRIDKRGMFASAAAVADANAVLIADYVEDTRQWVAAIRARTGAECVWLIGHSEGGLVALSAAQMTSEGAAPDGVCGVVTLAAAGRPLSIILREQLVAQLAGTPLMAQADTAISELEAGRRVDVAPLHPGLRPLFAPAVQGFLIDIMARDPAQLAARLSAPLLIVQGESDLQTSVADARALATANPAATLMLLPGVNHVLKPVPAHDRAANLATYSDPNLPLADGVAATIAHYIIAHTPQGHH